MQKTLAIAIMATLMLCACSEHNAPASHANSLNDQNKKSMNSYIAIFEIPATDISRAINFYENILDLKVEKIEIPGMEMGLLPYEDQLVTGVITKGEGYEPSAGGVTVYLNAGNDLQVVLDKVESNGGTIVLPKTPHADENGFFALFLDTEGNRIGLNSPE